MIPLLYPFYLMRYEHAIKNTPDKYDAIENEAHKVYDKLINAYSIGEISKKELENIMQLCEDVVTELSNNTDIKERLVNVMGTEVLLTAEERGEQRGKAVSLIGIVIKKIIKNKSIEVIADETEEDIETIRPLYNAIITNPGKTPEEIYAILQD